MPGGHFFLCGVIGILTSVAFVYITQYYTEYRYRPVKSIAEASQTGPATNIIAGHRRGPRVHRDPGPGHRRGHARRPITWASPRGLPNAGLFGTAVATMGMLATAAYILAMDTFGPITDNAGGIVEMSQQPEEIRKKTDRLDAVGNTTKALTKGYAIGSAALAAFLLFSAYMDEVRQYAGISLESAFPIDLSKPVVFVGALLGAELVFLFSSLAIRAVGRAAQAIIDEVRRQYPSCRASIHDRVPRGLQARLRRLRGHRDQVGAPPDGVARPARGSARPSPWGHFPDLHHS